MKCWLFSPSGLDYVGYISNIQCVECKSSPSSKGFFFVCGVLFVCFPFLLAVFLNEPLYSTWYALGNPGKSHSSVDIVTGLPWDRHAQVHYLKHDTPVCTPGHQYLEAVMLITILHPSDMRGSSKKDLKAVIIKPSQMSAGWCSCGQRYHCALRCRRLISLKENSVGKVLVTEEVLYQLLLCKAF